MIANKVDVLGVVIASKFDVLGVVIANKVDVLRWMMRFVAKGGGGVGGGLMGFVVNCKRN